MPKKTRIRSMEVATARKSTGFGVQSGTTVLEQSPEIESVGESESADFNLPQLQGMNMPPPLQRSVDILGKAPNSTVRQQIMRSLQNQYGNSYAQSVARYNNVSHVQVNRQAVPATQPTPVKPVSATSTPAKSTTTKPVVVKPANSQPVTKKVVVVKSANGQPVTKKTVIVKPTNPTSKKTANTQPGSKKPATTPANAQPGAKKPATKPAAKKPTTNPTNTQPAPQQPPPTGDIAASEKWGGKASVAAYGKPITISPKQVATPQTDLGFGGSNSGTLDVKPNNTWEQNSTTANESGNGTRTLQQDQRKDGNYDVESNSSQTDGDWERNSTSNKDKLGVTTDTTNSQTGTGSQSYKTETYTQPGSTETRTNTQTTNDGTWVTNEKKTATYSDQSAEKNRDQRVSEVTTTESSGKGNRVQISDSTEDKSVVTNGNVTTTTTKTTTPQIRDRVDGERSTRETKITEFGQGNKDKKVRETAVKGSSSTGVRDISDDSTENKTENDDFSGTTVKNTNRTGSLDGTWEDVDEKTTEYSDRRESSSTTTFGTGRRNQIENVNDTKNVTIGQNQIPVTTGTKITDRTDKITGTWGEQTRKEKQQGITALGSPLKISSYEDVTVTSSSGKGTRSEIGYEKATDYVDKAGRERSRSLLTNEKRVDGTETTKTTTSASDGVNWNGTAKVTYNRGSQYSKDGLYTFNKPKDQAAPPANPKFQEAVLWNKNFGGFNGAKQNAINAGTYSKQGDVEQYSYNGAFDQTASNATVTTGSASYAGSVTKGYAVDGRQYSRTDKGKLGAVDWKNEASASSIVGATGTVGGGATLSWNGDPSLTAKANASGFFGAKGNVSNTTTANLGAVGATTTLTGEALVGGTADARAELGISTKALVAQGEASAFLGGKVSGTAQGAVNLFGVDLITAKGTAEASVGVGAGAKGAFNVDWTTGTVTIGGGVSATVGLGAGASGETTIFFGKAAQQAKKGIGKAAQQAKRGIGAARQRAAQFAGAAKQKAKTFVGVAKQKARTFVGAAKQKAKTFVGAARQKTTQFVAAAKQKAKTFVGAAKQKAKNFVGTARQKVGNAVRVAKQRAKTFVAKAKQKVGNAVRATRQRVGNAVRTARQKVGNAIRTAKQKAKTFVAKARQKVGSAVRTAKQKAKNFVAKAKQKVGNGIRTARQKVGNAVRTAKQKAKTFVAKAKQKAKTFVAKAKQKVTKTVSAVKRKATNVVRAAKQKATNVVRAAKQKATNVVRAAKQKASNAFAAAKRNIGKLFRFGKKP
jgi:vacuolar-type H+-ATPase subunit H